jgi:hypothetical protein
MDDDERAAWLLIAAPALVFVVLLLGDVVLPAAAWCVAVLAEWAGAA